MGEEGHSGTRMAKKNTNIVGPAMSRGWGMDQRETMAGCGSLWQGAAHFGRWRPVAAPRPTVVQIAGGGQWRPVAASGGQWRRWSLVVTHALVSTVHAAIFSVFPQMPCPGNPGQAPPSVCVAKCIGHMLHCPIESHRLIWPIGLPGACHRFRCVHFLHSWHPET